jgi:hypothetical protein
VVTPDTLLRWHRRLVRTNSRNASASSSTTTASGNPTRGTPTGHIALNPGAAAGPWGIRAFTWTSCRSFQTTITRPTGILLTDENLFRWQHSDPIGYAAWFRARSEITRRLVEKRHASVADVPTWRTRTPLQRVVQILKWHCMITFAADLDNRPPSILITTLAGRAYDGEPDLFTAVRGVLDNMTQYVERRNDKWWVPNPAHEEENFTDKWNDYPERRKAFYR